MIAKTKQGANDIKRMSIQIKHYQWRKPDHSTNHSSKCKVISLLFDIKSPNAF